MKTKIVPILAAVLVSAPLWFGQAAAKNTRAARPPARSGALETAVDAYIYGYALVLEEMTLQLMLETGQLAGMNQFKHTERLLKPEDRSVKRPNNDTLYSQAFLDLSAEPVILHVPDTTGLYYLMQIMDAWTNTFAAPGTRTTGTSPRDFAIVGPDWKGHLPRPVKVIKSPTNLVWIVGRTQVITDIPPEGTCEGIDYTDVNDLMEQYTLTPLSQWPDGHASSPFDVSSQEDPAPTPPELVAELTGVEFFEMLSGLMEENPAATQDMPALKRFEAIGFKPGEPFTPPDDMEDIVNAAPETALPRIKEQFRNLGEEVNGWRVTVSDIGTYGTNYLNRAAVAWGAPGANLPEDGFYPSTEYAMVDGELEKLNGANRYVIHFDPVPPVNAFWSVTLYDRDGYLLENEICRYAIHSTDQALIGQTAVDILLQPDAPDDKDKTGFWLPTPPAISDDAEAADFSLVLRMYWPDRTSLQGKWAPPPVEKIQE